MTKKAGTKTHYEQVANAITLERIKAEIAIENTDLSTALQAIVNELIGPLRPYSADSYLPEHFVTAASAALAKSPAPTIAQSSNIPRIGDKWIGQGGIYAGVMRGRDGAPDYHLIVGVAIRSLGWDDSIAAAKEMKIEGHTDFTLPDRQEQALQFANVPELFEPEYYWSGTQHAANSDYAWFQDFDFGNQHHYGKSAELRARAVRRLIIQ